MGKNKDITSPGHKLGQIIGNFFEQLFGKILIDFADRNGFYCDRKGSRPSVRKSSRKVTWRDLEGNPHDLDFVIEKNGSTSKLGEPVAFIELAWRRYTKHSRNKAGEIEGALPHLQETYKGSCCFTGAIISGQWTDGGMHQMESHGIKILYIPFEIISECFKAKGIELDYPEKASDDIKFRLIEEIELLSDKELEEIQRCLLSKISGELKNFMNELELKLLRKIKFVRIIPLFGNILIFNSIQSAIKTIETFSEKNQKDLLFQKFEVQVMFENGDFVDGTFNKKDGVVQFLGKIAS